MKNLYKILLSIICLMLSFTLTSEQKTQLKLNAAEITDQDTDSETDGNTVVDNDPDNYVDRPTAYGPGPATNEGCSVTTVD